jgi:hypothetical protein
MALMESARMFATVVGLMSDFVFHRSGDEAQTLVAYVAWLRRQS